MGQIVILGAGAIGSLAGAWLAHHPGNRVTLVAKQRHVDAVKANGLLIRSKDQEYPVPALEISAQCPPLEPDALLLLACKATDIEPMLRPIADQLKPGMLLVALQNGIGIRDQIASVIDDRCDVLRCLSFVGALFLEPGQIEHTGGHTFQVEEGSAADRLIAAAEGTPLVVKATPDIKRQVFFKAILNSVINPLSAIHRCRVGQLGDPQFQEVVQRVIHELVAVSEKEGVHFEEQEIQKAMDRAFSMIATSYSSMYQDLLKGHRSEIDFINGAFLQMARKHKLSVPQTESLVEQIHSLERTIH